MSLQQNYVTICDWAHDALKRADEVLTRLTDEEIFALRGLIDEEAKSDQGKSQIVALIKDVVSIEAAYRRPQDKKP